MMVRYRAGVLQFLFDWDYSHTPFHYRGVIRLDYAPVWFVTGLLFEKILSKSS